MNPAKLLTLIRPDRPLGFVVSLLVTIVAVVGCVQWIDTPLLNMMNEHRIENEGLIKLLLSFPIFASLLSGLYLLVHVLFLRGHGPTSRSASLCAVATSCLMAASVKNMLKVGFGRTWPHNTPSYFPDDNLLKGLEHASQPITEGFHPFTPMREFAAFPSGSTIITISFLITLGALFPRTRIPALLYSPVVPLLLVLTGIHWVSDIVGGLFVGTCVGLFTLKIHRSPR